MNGINIDLLINPIFWDNLQQPEHKLGLVKHELLHICFEHLTTLKFHSDHVLANITEDLEINSIPILCSLHSYFNNYIRTNKFNTSSYKKISKKFNKVSFKLESSIEDFVKNLIETFPNRKEEIAFYLVKVLNYKFDTKLIKEILI